LPPTCARAQSSDTSRSVEPASTEEPPATSDVAEAAKPQVEAQEKSKTPEPAAGDEPAKGAEGADKGCGTSAEAAKGFVDQPGKATDAGGKRIGPRWACDNTTVTIDPVWRGQRLVFRFDIRNEGDEDLRISARGG
jgi:hypothetical protein